MYGKTWSWGHRVASSHEKTKLKVQQFYIQPWKFPDFFASGDGKNHPQLQGSFVALQRHDSSLQPSLSSRHRRQGWKRHRLIYMSAKPSSSYFKGPWLRITKGLSENLRWTLVLPGDSMCPTRPALLLRSFATSSSEGGEGRRWEQQKCSAIPAPLGCCENTGCVAGKSVNTGKPPFSVQKMNESKTTKPFHLS